MGSEGIAYLSIWLTTGAWLLISLIALLDSVLEYQDEQEEAAFARHYGTNKQRFLARCRLGQARWFLVGFGAAFLTGVVGTMATLKNPPPPDASLYTALARILLITSVFSLWRCKRSMRMLRRNYEEIFRSEDQSRASKDKERADHIEHLAKDTNTEVHEISDQLNKDTKDREEDGEAN